MEIFQESQRDSLVVYLWSCWVFGKCGERLSQYPPTHTTHHTPHTHTREILIKSLNLLASSQPFREAFVYQSAKGIGFFISLCPSVYVCQSICHLSVCLVICEPFNDSTSIHTFSLLVGMRDTSSASVGLVIHLSVQSYYVHQSIHSGYSSFIIKSLTVG